MEAARIFEIGSIIISKENNWDAIDATLKSIKEQEEVSRKIVVMSIAKQQIKEKDKKWINDRTKEFKDIGTQEFKFVDIVVDDASMKDSIIHVFKTTIFKPMAVRIHSVNGDKKGRIQLTHFGVIGEGCIYENAKYFSFVKDMFETDRKSFVVYSNYRGKKINVSNLNDECPAVYHTHGFNFFVVSSKEKSIIECYDKVRKHRAETKKEDKAMHKIDSASYKDIVFAKSTVEILPWKK